MKEIPNFRFNFLLFILFSAGVFSSCYYGILHWISWSIYSVITAIFIFRFSRDKTITCGFVLLCFGIFTGIQGYTNQYPGTLDFGKIISDFYANVSTEAISIAITVIIIDSLYKQRDRKQDLKNKLISELRDDDPKIVARALTEIKKNNWLKDGSLRNAYLCGVDLSKFDLSNSDFSGAYLSGANLSYADLTNSFLKKADLSESDLSGADLTNSNLSWANLEKCNLNNALMIYTDLSGAIFNRKAVDSIKSLKKATMPDGATFEEWLYENQKEFYEKKIHTKPISDNKNLKELFNGHWKALCKNNQFQVRIEWNEQNNRFEGFLVKNGKKSSHVGFKIGELVYMAFKTDKQLILKERCKWKSGVFGHNLSSKWENGIVDIGSWLSEDKGIFYMNEVFVRCTNREKKST